MSVTVSPPSKDASRLREFVFRLDLWSRWMESRTLAYAFFAAIYVVPNLILAHGKLLWDDEFFTLYISKTKDWSELWRALSTGADQHPPAFYYLTHLIFGLAGTSHITLRLPALIGFGLCCVSLSEITRRLIGPRWAVPAMLLPLTGPVLYYATEARGYGPEIGLLTFALLMWILAAEQTNRRWAVPALGIALCLAVASHYYAVLFLLPLAVGEITRERLRRSVDFPIWCAFSAVIIPLLLFAPIILKAKGYAAHFWAVPHFGSAIQWYPTMTGATPLVLLAAGGIVFLLRIPADDESPKAPLIDSLPIVLGVTACALLPFAGGVIAMAVTKAYSPRYFIGAVPGLVILLVWGLRRIMRNDAAGPAIATAICLVLCLQQWRELRAGQNGMLRELRSAAILLREAGDAPILMSGFGVFHELSFYSRRELVNKLVYAADPHQSVRYLGEDTIDRGLLDLAPWFPLNVVWWHDWWREHSYSLVYEDPGSWSWFTFALRDVGNAELLSRATDNMLFGVTRTKVPPDDRTSSDPTGKPAMYDRLPKSGPSLCSIYFSPDDCPKVDDPSLTAPTIAYPR